MTRSGHGPFGLPARVVPAAMRNLSVTRKLALGFGVIVAAALFSVGFVSMRTRQLAEMERVNTTSDHAIESLDRMRYDIEASRASIRDYVIGLLPLDRDRARASLADSVIRAGEARRIIAQDGPPQLLAAFDAYAEAVRGYNDQSTERYIQFAESGRRQTALALVGGHHGRPYRLLMEARYRTLRRQADIWARYWDRRGDEAVAQTSLIVAMMGTLTTLISIVMAWIISRAISAPLRDMTAAMNALAAGDTDVAVPENGSADEIGSMSRAIGIFKDAAIEKTRLEREAAATAAASDEERRRRDAANAERARDQARVVERLAAGLSDPARGNLVRRIEDPFAPDYEPLRTDFNAAIAQLGGAVHEVATNTAAIEASARGMSEVSDDISRRSTQQARSLQAAATVLNDITSTVMRSAATVAQAQRAVAHARSDAERSGDVVRRTVTAMNQIEQASAEVLGVTDLIDGIATKTNLLALNAAVEAARAGVEGRGFAVVALEVRTLAQQASDAARQIKALTLRTDERIREGVGLARQTGVALEGIVDQVIGINEATQEITETTQQQSAALARANAAISEIETVTRQNAAMADRATFTAHSLSDQTQKLDQLVSRFKTG